MLMNLLGGGRMDMLLTDPPYNVDYSGKNEFLNKLDESNRIQKDIENDNIDNFEEFLTKIFNNIKLILSDYNTIYAFISDLELCTLKKAMHNANIQMSSTLIWAKNNHVLGRMDYNAKHECCQYGWYNHHKFYGDFSTTLLEFPKPLRNELHPTMKPIELLVKLIKDGSPTNANVIDVFGGSGSTLIACEQLQRNCYMMEIDPKYCQIIINRWEEYTGKTATKIN